MLEKDALQRARAERDVSEAEAQLADRLDRLSAPLAESVLARAIDLHQDQEFGEDGSVSFAELADLAGEIGIDAGLVRQALLEALDTEHEPKESLFEKLFGPTRITGGIVAEASAEQLGEKIDEWMTEVEGMFPVSSKGSVTRWEDVRANGRLAASLQGVDMSHPSAEVRQTELSRGDQLIEIGVDSKGIQYGALIVLAIGVGLGGAAGLGVAFNETFANFLVRFMIPFGIGSTLGIAGAAATARHYTNKVKRTINRALDGIVHLTTFKRRKRKASGQHGENPAWSDIVTEIYE